MKLDLSDAVANQSLILYDNGQYAHAGLAIDNNLAQDMWNDTTNTVQCTHTGRESGKHHWQLQLDGRYFIQKVGAHYLYIIPTRQYALFMPNSCHFMKKSCNL